MCARLTPLAPLFLLAMLDCTGSNPAFQARADADARPSVRDSSVLGSGGSDQASLPPGKDATNGTTNDATNGTTTGTTNDATNDATNGTTNDATGGGVHVACPPGTPNLALCLRCEGVVRDESTLNHPVSSTEIAFAAGPDGLACVRGTTSDVSVPVPALELPDFSIEAWILPRVLPAAGARAGIIDRENAVGIFVGPDGSLTCSIPKGIAVMAKTAVAAGVWTSLACTLGEGTLALWVNGRKITSIAAGNLTGAATNGSVTLGSNNPSGDPFDGAFDNVRIWHGVRTAAQICEDALGCR